MLSRRKKQRMWLKIVILSLTVILACCCSCGKKGESGRGKSPSVDDNELPIITDPDLD